MGVGVGKMCMIVGWPSSSVSDRTLRYCRATNEEKCGCKYFDFEGILCRHLIYFFNCYVFNGSDIPDGYTLIRWCKGTKTDAVLMEGVEIKDHPNEGLVSRLMVMNRCTRKLVELAVMDTAATTFAYLAMDDVVVEVMRILYKTNTEVVHGNQ